MLNFTIACSTDVLFISAFLNRRRTLANPNTYVLHAVINGQFITSVQSGASAGRLRQGDYSEDLGADGRVILKYLKDQGLEGVGCINLT